VSPDYFTPPELARRWGISPDKVVSWLRSGELRGINLALRAGPGKRARWRISLAEVEAFEQRRGATPTPRRTRRTKEQAEVIPFF
jgi:hypothetical protein